MVGSHYINTKGIEVEEGYNRVLFHFSVFLSLSVPSTPLFTIGDARKCIKKNEYLTVTHASFICAMCFSDL